MLITLNRTAPKRPVMGCAADGTGKTVRDSLCNNTVTSIKPATAVIVRDGICKNN